MGCLIAVKLLDNTYVSNKFDVAGLLTNTFGSRKYPVSYSYDAQGRMKTMTTWQSYTGNQGAAITAWNYDVYRGWLTNKSYADGLGPKYTYTPAGRTSTRIWARSVTNTYSYDNVGGLTVMSYSDSTPGVTYSYDRLGRQKTITQNGMTTTFTYNDAGKVLSESYSGGTLTGLSVTNGYDQFLRRTNLVALNSTTPLLTNSYSFDAGSRLQTVRDGGTNSATYTYVANSRLVSQILFTNGSVQRMVTTKSYDLLNRLTNIVSATNGTTLAGFAYQYDDASQRTMRTDEDGSYWVYTYDALGQVVSGKKYWSDGTPVAGQQFEYSFDDIGNRKMTGSGGDQFGASLRYANYSANNLNQCTARDVPSYVNVVGSAKTNATVSLWTADGWYSPTIRHRDYYRGELAVNNSTGALWLTVTNLAVLANGTNSDIVTNMIGNLFLPKNQEGFSYDGDANLTVDGRWVYTWDGENRLVQMIRDTDSPGGARQKLTFEYDSKGRRIRKKFYTYTSVWVLSTDTVYLYDGWNLVAELDAASSNGKLRTYIWGLDLSGSEAGAGGVGGLLKITDYTSGTAHQFVAYDGNGNVTALADGATGALAGRYDYGPFGESLRATGAAGRSNPVRFSSKLTDPETGLVYYGYRHLNSVIGRWLSRDPIGEDGGFNLYGFVENNPLLRIDPYGWCGCKCLAIHVTYEPGGDTMQLHWYTDPSSGRLKYGDTVHVVFEVDGNANLCKYYQDESNSSTDIRRPDGTRGHWQGQNNETIQENYDDLGYAPPYPGNYLYSLHWDVTFRCISSDPSTPPLERHDGLWWFLSKIHYPPN